MINFKISDVWNELKKININQNNSPFIKKDFLKTTGNDPVYLSIAKSFPSNDCGILLDSQAVNFPEDLNFPLSENFEIKTYMGDKGNKFLWFFLKKNTGYEKQFEIICYDLAVRAIKEINSKKTIESFINNIKKWQDFLKEKKGELSHSKIKGLFSELYFLKNILIKNVGIKKAIQSWKPIDETHDFVLKNLSIEIKSTTTSPIKKIKISSLKQLDETLTKKLYIYLLQMGENTGDSLPDIIDSIRQIINNDNEDYYLFESKLIKEKYFEQFKDKYKNRKFFKNNEQFYLIEKNFPRLRETDLKIIKREGIISASYEININACIDYKINIDDFYNEIKN